MEAVAWSAIGVLAATLGVFTAALLSLSARIQAIGDGLRDKIDEQGRELGARIEEQGRALGDRIGALGGRIDAHVERHAG
jgi:hypothetical protein